MEESIKFSIIIPVYNVESYLHQCVDSVLNQDYQNFEIILVDDGSTDNSGLICDKYASDNPKSVKCIHKENGGLSDARNCGIMNSTGNYLMFLDSDDFLTDIKALTTFSNRILTNNTDVLIYAYTKYYKETNVFSSHFPSLTSMPHAISTKQEQTDFLFKNGYYTATACNKIIKRDLFKQNLLFEDGVYSEDIEWCAKLLQIACRFDFIDEEFYAYRQRSGSISHSINDKKCSDLCKHIINCIKMTDEADDGIKKYLSIYSAYQYGTFFVVQALAKNPQDRLLNELKDYRWILKFHNGNKKVLALYIITKIIGYKTTCRLIHLFYRSKRHE